MLGSKLKEQIPEIENVCRYRRYGKQALRYRPESGNAKRKQLVKQFLGESFVLTILATLIALILLQLFIPFYNNLSAKELNFAQLFSANNLLLLIILIFTIGLMSGLYPAFFISSFQPVSSLKSMK